MGSQNTLMIKEGGIVVKEGEYCAYVFVEGAQTARFYVNSKQSLTPLEMADAFAKLLEKKYVHDNS